MIGLQDLIAQWLVSLVKGPTHPPQYGRTGSIPWTPVAPILVTILFGADLKKDGSRAMPTLHAPAARTINKPQP